VPEKEAPETAPDSPLLDLSDAAVKKLTHSAKKRGYVTHDQINSVLPPEEVNSQEIVDVLADETEVIEPDERRQRNGKDESTEGVDVEEIWRKPMSVRSPIPSPQPALCRGGVGWAAPRPAVVD
jgi:RNA polymerase primary sigma factor